MEYTNKSLFYMESAGGIEPKTGLYHRRSTVLTKLNFKRMGFREIKAKYSPIQCMVQQIIELKKIKTSILCQFTFC